MANLGRVAYVHRGAYNSDARYEKYDVVYESTTNSAYAYINDVATIGNAVTNATYWTLLVSGSELNSTAENMPYLFIKYSEDEPTTDGDMSDVPGDWLGIYIGTSHTAPTTVISYAWSKIKGEQGIQGIPGITGESGVYVGTEEPADPLQTVWVDTDGTPTKLYFKDKVIQTTDWVADATYAEFPFKADITCLGVLSTMYASLAFAYAEATSGDFAPVCDTGTDIVTIYAAVVPAGAITIPVIEVLSI